MVITKINNTIGLLRKLQNVLPRTVLVTIYEVFVRPHLDYGDIPNDKAFNLSFHQKPESIQYRACLRITGATPGTFIKKIYQGLTGAIRSTFITGAIRGTFTTGAIPGTIIKGAIAGTFITGAIPGTFITGALLGTFVNGAIPGTFITGAIPGTFITGAIRGTFIEKIYQGLGLE